MTRYRGASSGFTLIEVLVAVLVFALLAGIAYSSLDRLAAVSAALDERSTRLGRVQRAVAALEADLGQIVGRLGRDAAGRVLPSLAGAGDALLARRAGRENPAALPRSTLQQFRWALVDGGLERVAWSEVLADPGTAPSSRVRFEGVTGLALRYLDATGSWHDQWPGARPPEQLPRAIELQLETEHFGRIRRLFAL